MQSSAWRRVLLCLLPMLPAGCGTGRFDAPPVARVVNPCDAITVVAYPAEFQARVADQRDAARGAEWTRMIDDYERMRDAVRACKGS